MSAPNDRRVTFGTYVIPTKTSEMDEQHVTQEIFMGSPGKAIGGKGKMTIGTQWGDGFTSMNTVWQYATETWNVKGMTTTGILLVTTPTELNNEGSDLKFLYIKNVGDTNGLLVSLYANVTAKYFIEIPPGGSIYLRGAHADLNCNVPYVKPASGSTTIEYIVANTE